MAKYWVGQPTEDLKCEICSKDFNGEFVDGATPNGWACMCMSCHRTHGIGLGTGKGQQYKVQEDGKWLKIAG